MSALRGAAMGALALTLLEATVSTKQASQNVTGVWKFVTSVFRRLVDPTVALIPQLPEPNASKPLAL